MPTCFCISILEASHLVDYGSTDYKSHFLGEYMKYAFPLALSLLLSACVSTTSQYQASSKSSMDRELKAWEEIQPITAAKCKKGQKEIPREKIMEFYDCRDALVNEHVFPVAAYPDLLKRMMLKGRELGIAYKKGKIETYDELSLKGQEAWLDYSEEYDQRTQRGMIAASSADAVSTMQRQQALTNLGTALSQPTLQGPQPSNTMAIPKNTRCTQWRNTVNCSEW